MLAGVGDEFLHHPVAVASGQRRQQFRMLDGLDNLDPLPHAARLRKQRLGQTFHTKSRNFIASANSFSAGTSLTYLPP